MYIDTWPDDNIVPCPLANESYQAFVTRCAPAIKQLQPTMSDTDIQDAIDDAWNYYVVNSATEMTVTLKREAYGGMYLDTWYGDWEIDKILSASLPTITFSAVEKARAGNGDTFKIAKSAEEKQIVFGWANIAKDANGNYPLDWDTDVTDPSELEAAAYSYVLKYRTAGEKHEGEAVGQLIESVMFTKEKQEALGIPDGIVPEGWWVGFYIPDSEVFAKVKSGEYEMFSVQGNAQRLPTGQ